MLKIGTVTVTMDSVHNAIAKAAEDVAATRMAANYVLTGKDCCDDEKESVGCRSFAECILDGNECICRKNFKYKEYNS